VKTVNFLGKRIPVPGNMVLRVGLGLVMIVGGVLGFLPVLGYWMLPLGLLILSIDFPMVRRFRRNITVKLGDWFKTRWPNAARRIGMTFRRRNRGSANEVQ
jgi:purine-cytosine permease-like protein